MSKPLSVDLIKRVVEAVDEGLHVDDAVKNFKVSRRAVYNWLERREKTGSLEPKSNYQKGHSHKIIDWDEFRKFAESNKYSTAKEMVAKWQAINQKTISESSMERALKKINYTSKKKLLAMPRQAKASERNF